jgi:hypothetical protein
VGWQEAYGSVLRRVLAEQGEYPIGVVGCWAKGINHPVCELDLIIISPSGCGFERRVDEGLILDMRYVDEGEAARQADSLLALSLTECSILQDPELRLASLVNSLKNRAESIRKSLASSALTNTVNYLGLGKRAFKEGYTISGCFWLLASGYSLLEALIFIAGDTPRPSHLMKQFRAYVGAHNQTLYSLLGLAEATTTTVKRRFDFLVRCYEAEALGLIGQGRLEKLLPILAAKKVFYLLEANRVVDAYLYLGYLIVEVLKQIYRSVAESTLKTKPHKFIEEIEDRSILGKGVVKLASFTNVEQTALQDVDRIIAKLAQSI